MSGLDGNKIRKEIIIVFVLVTEIFTKINPVLLRFYFFFRVKSSKEKLLKLSPTNFI